MRPLKKIIKDLARAILPLGVQQFLYTGYHRIRAFLARERPIRITASDPQSPAIEDTVVVCLIYQSTGYADFVWESFRKYTPGAEFLFVANDATEKVKRHLAEKNYPHVIFENEDKSEYYLRRVYRAWNYGGMNAPGKVVVFVNSDMTFSAGWLPNLLKSMRPDRTVCSRLVESGKLLSGKHGIAKNFGRTYKDFDDAAFQAYAKTIVRAEIRPGGLYMPCAIYKDTFVASGGYPIGNRTEPDGSETSGDFILFYERLAPIGVRHYTAFDSIVYHVQEGEMDE